MPAPRPVGRLKKAWISQAGASRYGSQVGSRRFPSAPRADFTLDELPESYEKLLFLTGSDQEPLFGDSFKELTTEAAKVVVGLYQALLQRERQHRIRCARFSSKSCGACLPST